MNTLDPALNASLALLSQEIGSLYSAFQHEGHKAFLKAVQPLFAEGSNLESFGWHQAPEYDDQGYPFQVNAHSPTINGLQEEDYYENPFVSALAQQVTRVLENIPTDDFARLFGRAATVVVTRNSLDVETQETDY